VGDAMVARQVVGAGQGMSAAADDHDVVFGLQVLLLRDESLRPVLPAEAVGQELVGGQSWKHEPSPDRFGADPKLAKAQFAPGSLSTLIDPKTTADLSHDDFASVPVRN